jgi:hypothetical protein
MTDGVAAGPESAGGELMAALLDLSSPQANYKQMIDGPGLLQPSDGVVLTFDRALTEYVLRHHELFSSRVEMGLGNVRPLIPLNVDPPLHSKYRRLLDLLFAPKRMDEQEEDITRRVVALIDGFIDAGECNFTEDFAVLSDPKFLDRERSFLAAVDWPRDSRHGTRWNDDEAREWSRSASRANAGSSLCRRHSIGRGPGRLGDLD